MKKFIKKLKINPYEIAEGLVVELWNLYEQLIFTINKLLGKYHFLKKNAILENRHIGERIFLLGNAPSLNDFDLTKLKNEIVIMVNRSFTHKDYFMPLLIISSLIFLINNKINFTINEYIF